MKYRYRNFYNKEVVSSLKSLRRERKTSSTSAFGVMMGRKYSEDLEKVTQ